MSRSEEINMEFDEMTNYLKHFPETGELLRSPVPVGLTVYEVNGHIHTPYSFSAFSDVAMIFKMAAKENIKILGINDFYTTSGYSEFLKYALENRIFPMFNIEFIALDRELQKKGVRVNDPNNPGRTYFSGKGLDFPESLDAAHVNIIEIVKIESLRQVETMVSKTNSVLADIHSDIRLDFQSIRKKYAQDLVRERHIAKALRISIFQKFPAIAGRKAFLSALYDGKEPKANLDSDSAVEIEIRNNLLKAGGKAFVEEDEKAFLRVDAVIDIIQNAGGIPCYPVLLDDPRGNITDYEVDKDALYKELSQKNIFCIELIPGRNDSVILEDFVKFFHSKGFIILFGTEHNTPDMVPLTVSCRHQVPLTDDLKNIGSEGACIIAAHQYLRAQESVSQVSQWHKLSIDQKNKLLTLGKAVVYHFLNI
ncbi:MAG: hypothetical protein NTV01_00605 [Bacteroidia bacterium]|nr:hypothetical protein [Bacteroidia bacterium]